MLTVLRVAALAALLSLPFSARAEPAAAPADSAPAQAAMPCPNAGKEGCCGGAGGCVQMQGQAAAGGEGGCPCQKARAAAAKAAEAEAAKQKAAQ
jgi:hypothetical protein